MSENLKLWDEEQEKLQLETEIKLLERLRINQRVLVTFKTYLDDQFKLVETEPYTLCGVIVGLDLHQGLSHVLIHFDESDRPEGPFKPSEVKIIE